ncbi:MAG: choice-of-anchor J domain-containing protein [Bacteroidales bacterium]|nr:choice-of-anchor J domain-containing protein [Bacteroidales bacterium]
MKRTFVYRHIIMLVVMMSFLSSKSIGQTLDTVYAVPYSYGFENGMSDWTTIDNNNDGRTWSTTTPLASSITAHGGTGYVGCSSFIGGVGALTPDDYLVSPAIAVTSNAVLKWYEHPGHSTYYAEHYSVYVSTTGNTLSDFDTTTPLFSVTLDATSAYHLGERQLDLSDYVGDTIHIAFRHHGCYDQWALLLDDISVEFGQIVSIPPATVPYATGFEPGDDSLWSFVNTAANGWYRGTAATANGNSLYISADSGATHSSTPVHGYLWAARELQFASSGDYRIGYDWIANGFQSVNYVYEYLRFFLVPHGVLFDTSFFGSSYANSNNKNYLPAGWISLSDNGNDMYLCGETTWQHHSQPFHLDNGGTYALVALWANHDPYMYSGPSYQPPAAIDNITVVPFSCQSQVSNLRLSTATNEGLTVEWDDPTGSQWAVYANNNLYGTTGSTSFFIADPYIAAATGNSSPVIGVSSICPNNDTSLMVTITANWEGYHVVGNNITCDPFDLPYHEDFESYEHGTADHLCWHHMGGFVKAVDTAYGHLSTRSLRLASNNNYTSQTITPKLNAPGNRLLVSFWALIPQNDTLGRLSVGVHRHYDEMQIDSVNVNTIELLSVRSGQSGWQHYTFSTESLDETGMVGVSFKLITPSYHNCYIDDLEITMIPESQDSVPPVVSLAGPTDAFVFVDTLAINATLLQGDTTGLTYIWHSSMADAGNAQFSILNSQFSIHYSAVGNDTITLVAANPYGADTAWHYVTVVDNLQVAIVGTSAGFIGDTIHYRAVVEGPDTNGLTFSWHSTMSAAGLAYSTIHNSQFTIVYVSSGIDTITLTATNSNGIHVATRVVNVSSACGTISSFPYYEGFDDYAWPNRESCWLKRTRSGIIDNEWRHMNMSLYHSGYGAMYSNGNVTVNDFDAWLVMPPINLPNADSIVFSFFVRPQYISNFYVLVSPSGDLWYDGFTDTLYIDRSTGYNTQWDSVALSLDAYRGRHIRVAFVHAGYNTLSNVAIDDVAISCGEIQIADTVWRTVTLNCDNTMGSVSGDGVYPDNSLVHISATAYEGFRFLGWSDGNANPSRLLLLVSNTTLTAYFDSIATPPLSDTVWHIVTVEANPEGVCELYGGGRYTEGETVEIGYIMPDTATKGGYWEFLGWSNGETNNPIYLKVITDTTIIANFQWVEDTTTEGIDIYPMSNAGCKISVYPNPAYREVTVSVSEPSTISILDMTGRTIIPPTQSTAIGCSDSRLAVADEGVSIPVISSFRFDVSNLTPGAYFVRIATAKGVLVRKLIVK